MSEGFEIDWQQQLIIQNRICLSSVFNLKLGRFHKLDCYFNLFKYMLLFILGSSSKTYRQAFVGSLSIYTINFSQITNKLRIISWPLNLAYHCFRIIIKVSVYPLQSTILYTNFWMLERLAANGIILWANLALVINVISIPGLGYKNFNNGACFSKLASSSNTIFMFSCLIDKCLFTKYSNIFGLIIKMQRNIYIVYSIAIIQLSVVFLLCCDNKCKGFISDIFNLPHMNIFLPFFLITLILHPAYSLDGIIELDPPSLQKLKDQSNRLVVYFYSDDCQFCKQFQYSFSILAALTTKSQKYDDIQFAQIAYNKNNEVVFADHHVESVPEIKVILGGVDSNIRYYQLEYDEMSVKLMDRWLSRVINPANFRLINSVPQSLESQQSGSDCYTQKCNKLIVQYNDHSLINALTNHKIYYQMLDVEFICTRATEFELGTIGFQHHSHFKTSSKCLENTGSSEIILERCLNFINNMRHYTLEHWNHAHITEIYQNRRTMFVLLVSNETGCRKYLRQYLQVKEQWNRQKDLENQLLPIFGVVDKGYNLEEFLKVKKFIGGYFPNGMQYPLPMLAYLSLNSEGGLQKILYEERYPVFKKSNLTIELWMKGILNSQIKTPFFRNDKKKPQMTDDQYQKDVLDLIEEHTPTNRILISSLHQLLYWKSLASSNKLPAKRTQYMFVFYIIKTNQELVKWIYKMKKWVKKVSSKVNFIYIDYLQNDFPQGINAKQLPLMLFYQRDKLILKSENILDVEKAKKTINKIIKEYNLEKLE